MTNRSKGKKTDSVNQAQADLLAILTSLRGKPCWSFVGGSVAGSMIAMDFGEKTPRKQPLNNPHLTFDAQNFDGEIGIFIEFASWRVDSESKVICSSTSSNHSGGAYDRVRQLLLNRIVLAVSVCRPGFDLTLEFEGKLSFKIFCNQDNEVDQSDNYSVHTRSKTIAVRAFSHVENCRLSRVREA